MMIRRIEALNYRCLHYIEQELGDFQVLVGANASGKTTFLDVVAFLGDLVIGGLDHAIEERTKNFQDLVWQRSGDRFELAIELMIPDERRELLKRVPYTLVRYEVAIGLDKAVNETAILSERVMLKTDDPYKEKPHPVQLSIFPMQRAVPKSLISQTKIRNTKTVINKVSGGNDNFYSEVYHAKGKGWAPSFKLGPRRSALGNLPEDEAKFPVSTWLKGLLTEGVQRIILNSLLMRKASPPGQGRRFRPDGSNLPWVIENFKSTAPERFVEWLAHLQTALPDIRNIRTVERPDDKHRYLIIEYEGGLDVPSWMASDGTLRLLALTLPAYLPEFTGVYLIEEPENGIHPRAVETMFQSLSSVYAAQILLATHSPVILSVAEPSQVLCFAKTSNGAVDIVLGTEHPALRDWKGETNLGALFAGGVLG
jgi:predicted ATPase